MLCRVGCLESSGISSSSSHARWAGVGDQPNGRGWEAGVPIHFQRPTELTEDASDSDRNSRDLLVELAFDHASAPQTDEAEFVDRVTRHLRRREYLVLIIGQGISASARNIVGSAQRTLGFTVLARTVFLQRIVREKDLTPQIANEAEEELDDVLSILEFESLQFWTVVLKDLQFSDTAVEAPEITKQTATSLKVQIPGYRIWALKLASFVYRRKREV